MELFQLRYAVVLAKHRNFSKAAAELFITQPTLSQQIQRLESEIGFRIFERTNRSVKPTKMGEMFLIGATNLLEQYTKFENDVRSMQDSVSKRISFGETPFGSPFATGAINKFQNDFPDAELKIIEAYDTDLINDVLDNQIDLALVSISWDDPRRKNLLVVPIYEEYFCAAMSIRHPLASYNEITLEQLSSYCLVFPAEKSLFKTILSEYYQTLGIKMPQSVNFLNNDARADYILSNDAVAFIFSGQKNWRNEPDIVFKPITPKIRCTFAIILKKEKKITPELNSLIQHIAIKKTGQRYLSSS